jgi:hypothetical protein
VAGTFQRPSTFEPVVPVAEPFDSVRPCESRLGHAGFGQAQVIEAELTGMWEPKRLRWHRLTLVLDPERQPPARSRLMM